MKSLLTLFVLLFSSSVFADDISDFEIEGISIGDSLLEHLSEEIILSEIKTNFDKKRDNKFTTVYLKNIIFEEYEYVAAIVKPNDSKYIIYGIRGMFDISNPEECSIKQNKIAGTLKEFFSTPLKKFNRSSAYDDTGQSKVIGYMFDLDNGRAGVVCYNYSEHVNIASGLDVTLRSKEYNQWLSNY